MGYNGFLTFCDPTHILKRVQIFILNCNNVLDFSDRVMYKTEIINAGMFRAITGITNTRVFSMDSRLKLDDKVAITIFDPSFINDFLSVTAMKVYLFMLFYSL